MLYQIVPTVFEWSHAIPDVSDVHLWVHYVGWSSHQHCVFSIPFKTCRWAPVLTCTLRDSHIATENQPCVTTPPWYNGHRVRVQSPSFKLFVSVPPFPITSWVWGGVEGRQSVCRTGWLCLSRAPVNRGCRLLMEHSGFCRCQLQIEQPSSKQIQLPGAAQIPLIC